MPDSGDPFDAPSSGGDLFCWDEHHGRLLLITPYEVERAVKTRHGVKDATRADITVLPELGRGELVELRDTLIFPQVVRSRLRAAVGTGRKVLGRLAKGDSDGKPWTLTDPTEADKAVARAYLGTGPAGSAAPAPPPPTQQSSLPPF